MGGGGCVSQGVGGGSLTGMRDGLWVTCPQYKEPSKAQAASLVSVSSSLSSAGLGTVGCLYRAQGSRSLDGFGCLDVCSSCLSSDWLTDLHNN